MPLVGLVHDGSDSGVARATALSARYRLPLVPSPAVVQFAISVAGASGVDGGPAAAAPSTAPAPVARSWASAPTPAPQSALTLLDSTGRVFTRPFDLVAYSRYTVRWGSCL